ncbi:MAG: zf-HC2 domain-containing protein [Anaerolineae bacterium]|nr:zf-HC2 domain-containing protein [Anaerolineae bacterium]NUQ03394.1 zf-HC2 domain-containing protein [Anaerolineae bacterium]
MTTEPNMTCRDVQRALPAYLHRELPPSQRGQVARHLAGCIQCGAHYQAQREIARRLEATVPLIGRGTEAGRFEQMWRGIAAQIAARRRQISMTNLVTSGAALMVVLLLALAWAPTASQAWVPTQPTAIRGDTRSTPVAVAFSSEDTSPATLMPPLQSNYAPAVGATDEP